MDFFAYQDAARRKTKVLILYFVLAVVLMVASIYLVAVATLSPVFSKDRSRPYLERIDWWQPDVLLIVAAATLGVITCGSLYKTMELSSGGERVATMLGGRRINPDTRDLSERRLLNVVEEMALASGIAVPPVFVLEGEDSINAFAAGFTPDDAVIGVNRGTLKYLTRDELQGVMAHEFSHILNGDMRLNLRLIGLLNGILLLAIIGYYLLRAGAFSGGAYSSRRGRGGGAHLLILGLATLVIGSVGLLFARLIKAAVSREREYLADASAVQFTRNPSGISGALKKIGGLLAGSRMKSPEAETASHMFFGSAFPSVLLAAFATHPPLPDRIRRIDPTFDGTFPKTQPLEAPRRAAPARRPAPRPAGIPIGRPLAIPGTGKSIPLDPVLVMAAIGSPSTAGVQYSSRLLADLPAPLAEGLRDLFSARAVVFAMLLDEEPGIRNLQLQLVAQREGDAAAQEAARLAPLLTAQGPAARLPMIAVVQSTLRGLSREQYDRFCGTVEELVRADQKISLLEFVIQRVLLTRLDRHFRQTKPPPISYYSVKPLLPHVVALLSTLAHVGHERAEQAQRAFELAIGELERRGGRPQLLAAADCTVQRLDQSLQQLARSSPAVKRQVIRAAAVCVAADRKVTVGEAELLRAIADSLDCPIPPLVTAPVPADGAKG